MVETPALELPPKPERIIIFILGGPGVGKGTQCLRLARELNFAHISVGEILRDEKNNPNSTNRELIEKHMKAGTIVPPKVAIDLLNLTMDGYMANGQTKFLVDGFPRDMAQATEFEKIFQHRLVLFFDGSREILLARLLNRGKTSGRPDDNREIFNRRMQGFLDDTMPVIEYFRAKGNVIRINCDGPLDEGYYVVKDVVQKVLDFSK